VTTSNRCEKLISDYVTHSRPLSWSWNTVAA